MRLLKISKTVLQNVHTISLKIIMIIRRLFFALFSLSVGHPGSTFFSKGPSVRKSKRPLVRWLNIRKANKLDGLVDNIPMSQKAWYSESLLVRWPCSQKACRSENHMVHYLECHLAKRPISQMAQSSEGTGIRWHVGQTASNSELPSFRRPVSQKILWTVS